MPENKCDICGTCENLNLTWYLAEYNTLCDKHEEQKFREASVDELFDKYFRPENSLDERIAKRYVSMLRRIAVEYRDKGKQAGDLMCDGYGISLKD